MAPSRNQSHSQLQEGIEAFQSYERPVKYYYTKFHWSRRCRPEERYIRHGTGKYFPSDSFCQTYPFTSEFDGSVREMPYVSGAGAIISNVFDYSKWIHALLERGGPISPEGHASLVSPCMVMSSGGPPFVGPMTYALGSPVTVYRGVDVIMHDDGLDAFGTFVVYLPRAKFGVVMMGNTQDTWNFAGGRVLAFRLIDEKLGVPKEEAFDWMKM